jgi:ABC-type Fe3+ transport system substrate-binding protein
MPVGKGILAVIIILVIALAGVSIYAVAPGVRPSSTVTTTLTSPPNYNSTVVDQCQAEGGTITLYSFFSPTHVFPKINSSITSAFPWFKITYVQLQFGDVATRALTEFKAGHVVADSIVDTRSDLQLLENNSALQAFYNPNIPIMNWTSGSDQYQTSFYFDPPLLIWNTNKVTDNSTLPTTWQGLANPMWKGQVAIDDPSTLNTAGPLFASLEPSMGNASWTAFMKSLAANNPIITQGTSDSYTDVATGQASVGIALIDDVGGGLANNPPVGYKYIAPTYGDPASIGILAGAPHPYCAELFEEYMTSYAGALALVSSGTPSGIPLVNTQYLPFWPYPANATILAAGPPSIYSEPSMWVSTFTGIFGP